MRYKIFPLFVIVLVCAFSAAAQSVVENETRVIVGDGGSKVLMRIDSPVSLLNANVGIWVVSPSESVLAKSDIQVNLLKGQNTVEIPVALEKVLGSDDLVFGRLKYAVGSNSGVVSLSRIVTDIFDLQVFGVA